MLSIIGALIPIALKFVGMWLDKSAADAEAKKAFIDFISQINKSGLISLEMRLKSQTEQEEQLKKAWEDDKKA